MKKILLLALPMIFLFSDCKKDEDFLFEMKYFNDFTITAGLNPFSGTHIFETGAIPTNSLALFSQNGVTLGELAEINPGRATMIGVFSSPEVGYIQEVSVKMFLPDDPTFDREIFYHDQIPNNASGDLGLIGTLINAKDFIGEEEVGIRIELTLRDISPETVDMRLNFSFFAK